jgi:hypothetical protein
MAKDYFLRMIDQIAAVLEEIDERQLSGDNSGAKAELNSRSQQAVGLDISHIHRMSPEAVAQLLNTSGGLRQGRAILLAELLLKDAEMHQEDVFHATIDYVHAFCLLADTVDMLDVEDQAIYRPKVHALATRLKDMQTNPYISEKLRQHESSLQI